jgi:hypothetical protein
VLSPGKWHERAPRDRDQNLRARKALLEAARDNPAVQERLLAICRDDILFYVNLFVWEYNPRHKGHEVGPFITWDFQDGLIQWLLDHIERDRDALIEKSREMGGSWIVLIIQDWLASFRPWQKFFCMSHSEAAVDRADDPDSLFWKVQFMHEWLPAWMPGSRAKHLKLRFAYDTRSSITGTSTSERSGVGGRASALLLDEFAKQTEDYEILGQTADTGCRIFVSTHYGSGTAFYGKSQQPDQDKFVLHWSMHPEKRRGLYRWSEELKRVEILDTTYEYPHDYQFVLDGSPTGGPFPGLRSPWYDAECLRRASRRDVAMHLDIDPQGSTSQYFEPAVIRQLIAEWTCDPYWQGDVQFDPDTGRPEGLVPAPGGPLKLWCRVRDGKPPVAPYCVGSDVSAGTGATPSVLHGGDAALRQQVFEYVNPHIDPKDLAKVAVALCWLFADEHGEGAKLCWEQQGPGLLFGKTVLELGYRNIYYRSGEQPQTMKVETSERPGWVPNNETITLLLGGYRSALFNREYVVRSEPALRECLDFKYDGRGGIVHAQIESSNDPSGARVNHGDRVVAGGLCLKMAKSRGIMQEPEDEAETAGPLSLAWRRKQAEQKEKVSRWG